MATLTRYIFLLLVGTMVAATAVSAAEPKTEYTEGNEQQRTSLVDRIGSSAETTPAELEVLLMALSDESPVVQRRAALAIASKGVSEAKATAPLLKILSGNDPAARAAAAFALGLVAPNDTKAAQALAEHVTDADETVRRASMQALQKMQVDRNLVRPVLLQALRSGDPAIVAAALHELASLGEQIVDDLQAALKHEEGRYWACLVIQEMGPVAKGTVEPLREVLQSEKPEDRLQAILALAAIGPAALGSAPDLAKILKDDDFEGARFAAAYALGRIAAKGVADEQLRAAASSEMPLLKLMGAWSLAKLYPDNADYTHQAIEVIFAGMKSDDATLSRLSARALVESDLPPEKTTPFAIAALEQSSPAAIEHVIIALAAQGKQALPRVKRGLANEKLRLNALRVVQKIGPDAAELLGDIAPLLGSEDEDVRREALFAIAALGPAAKDAAPELLQAYGKETVRENRLAAIFAAGRMGPAAEAFIPHMKKLSSHPDDEQARVAALWALARIASDDETVLAEAIPAMIEALSKAERPVIKVELAQSLGDLGKRAEQAVPALKALQSDPDSRVREAATAALERIGG